MGDLEAGVRLLCAQQQYQMSAIQIWKIRSAFHEKINFMLKKNVSLFRVH